MLPGRPSNITVLARTASSLHFDQISGKGAGNRKKIQKWSPRDVPVPILSWRYCLMLGLLVFTAQQHLGSSNNLENSFHIASVPWSVLAQTTEQGPQLDYS